MTTIVKVIACVSEEKEVKVDIHSWATAEKSLESTTTLQDGEEKQFYVYDNLEVTVSEVLKKVD